MLYNKYQFIIHENYYHDNIVPGKAKKIPTAEAAGNYPRKPYQTMDDSTYHGTRQIKGMIAVAVLGVRSMSR